MIKTIQQLSNIDVVYIVKEDENNEELRYSLRSLDNLPHRKVFVVGYKPSWVKNVDHIPITQSGQKYENVSHTGVFRTVCGNSNVSNDFILMNDDFFIINKINNLPAYRRDHSIEYWIKHYKDSGSNGPYIKTMINTEVFLKQLGFSQIDSYELHVPMVYNKEKYLALRSMYPNNKSLQMRTLYGNFYHLGGKRIEDVKVFNGKMGFSKESSFLSSLDETFENGEVGRFIRSLFPIKSDYEK